jgi:hypothetical protein
MAWMRRLDFEAEIVAVAYSCRALVGRPISSALMAMRRSGRARHRKWPGYATESPSRAEHDGVHEIHLVKPVCSRSSFTDHRATVELSQTRNER